MDIDLVYLWCDGNEPVFEKEKQYWQEKLSITVSNSNGNSRYVDNEELRYSLRSVMENAPWIHKIYIITDSQVPKWLDLSKTNKIEIIDHKDIIPTENLPCFNSAAIETYVTNIPNLSEYFILANDDCFIYKPVKPTFFFDKNGLPIVRLKKPKFTLKDLKTNLYRRTILYSQRLFYKKFSKLDKYFPHHNMDAYSKTSFNECLELFKDEFDVLRTQKFRQKSIQRVIMSFYLINQKKSKLELISGRKAHVSIIIDISSAYVMSIRLAKTRPTLLCINDNDYPIVKNEDRSQVKNFYHYLFPNPQPYEKLEETDIDVDKVTKIAEVYKKYKLEPYKKVLNTIFSMVNVKNKKTKVRHKVITVLGLKLKIKLK